MHSFLGIIPISNFFIWWLLNNLLLHKKASRNLTDIGISSEYFWNDPATFNYTLFNHTLECVAAIPTGKIKLMLRFASISDRNVNNWVKKHLAMMNNASRSSIILQLNNITSLVISSFWHVDYDLKMIKMLPDWLGMFPKLMAIEFVDQLQENVCKLEEKEFVRKVAIVCWKVGLLDVCGWKVCLDEVHRDFKIKMNMEGGQGLGKGGSGWAEIGFGMGDVFLFMKLLRGCLDNILSFFLHTTFIHYSTTTSTTASW